VKQSFPKYAEEVYRA
jgi:hypothetical protein